MAAVAAENPSPSDCFVGVLDMVLIGRVVQDLLWVVGGCEGQGTSEHGGLGSERVVRTHKARWPPVIAGYGREEGEWGGDACGRRHTEANGGERRGADASKREVDSV